MVSFKLSWQYNIFDILSLVIINNAIALRYIYSEKAARCEISSRPTSFQLGVRYSQ